MTQGNLRGIFPRPSDTEESYLEQIRTHAMTEHLDQETEDLLLRVYGVRPEWVTVTFQNKDLRFWEAGCTWIEDGKGAVQLKSIFKEKDTLFSLYTKQEVIAHECVHLMRAPLCSETFEECFSYRLSPECSRSILSTIRAFFGPMFSSSREVGLLFGLLFSSWIIFLTNTFFEHSWLSMLSIGLYSALVFVCSILLFRTMGRWKIFHRCSDALKNMGVKYPYHLMIRLVDDEIERFASHSTEENFAWIEKERHISFRWNFLAKTYLSENLLASHEKFWQSR